MVEVSDACLKNRAGREGGGGLGPYRHCALLHDDLAAALSGAHPPDHPRSQLHVLHVARVPRADAKRLGGRVDGLGPGDGRTQPQDL